MLEIRKEEIFRCIGRFAGNCKLFVLCAVRRMKGVRIRTPPAAGKPETPRGCSAPVLLEIGLCSTRPLAVVGDGFFGVSSLGKVRPLARNAAIQLIALDILAGQKLIQVILCDSVHPEPLDRSKFVGRTGHAAERNFGVGHVMRLLHNAAGTTGHIVLD